MAFDSAHPLFQTTDTFQQLIQDLNNYGDNVDSDLSYLDSAIGPGGTKTLRGLDDFTAGTLVDALNELDSDLHGSGGGSGSDLTTQAKTIVGAINEIEAAFDANAGTIDVDSALAVTSNGAMTFNGGSSGNFEVDVEGDIILDGNGGNVYFKDGGTTDYQFATDGTISRTGNVILDVSGNITLDADGNSILFKNGGGLDTVTHTLADDGAYTIVYPVGVTHQLNNLGDLAFNVPGDDVYFNGTSSIYLNLDAASNINMTGTSASITNSSGDFTVDAAGGIVLDADSGGVLLKDGGTQYAAFTNTSGNLIIKSGSTTAMTFNGAKVTVASTITLPSSGAGSITSSEISANTVNGAIDEVNARIPNVFNRSSVLLNP